MHLFPAALAALFIILGFTGFALGRVPAIVCGVLAGAGVVGTWKARADRQRPRDHHAMPPRAA